MFRWLYLSETPGLYALGVAIVISGLFFGIIMEIWMQGVYASILGCLSRIFLNRQAACGQVVLLHMGANIWSLVLPELAAWLLDSIRWELP